MTDPVDDFIADIHVELCRFMRCGNAVQKSGVLESLSAGASDAAVSYSIGAADAQTHRSVPSVAWVEGDGKTDPAELSANDPIIFHDAVTLHLRVTAKTKADCRFLFMNLRNAARRVCGTQIAWESYSSPCEDKSSQLSAKVVWEIVATAALTIPIPKNPQQLDGFPEPLADYKWRKVLSVTDKTLDNL